MEHVIFWILGSGAVLSAAAVVVPPVGRNPVHGALALVVSFFFLASLYVMLVANLIAALQILIYAGAIVVLFLFVIMLLNLRKEDLGHPRPTLTKVAATAAVGFFIVTLLGLFWDTPWGTTTGVQLAKDSDFGSIERVGRMLYTDYLVPFELTSILLLVAIIGALVMAKRKL